MKCNSSLDHFFLIEGSEWSCALIYFRPENLMRQKDVRTHTYGVRRICTHICSWSRNNDWTKLQLASNGPNFKHDLGQLKSSKKHRWTHFQASPLSQKKSHEFICFSNIGLIFSHSLNFIEKKKEFSSKHLQAAAFSMVWAYAQRIFQDVLTTSWHFWYCWIKLWQLNVSQSVAKYSRTFTHIHSRTSYGFTCLSSFGQSKTAAVQ